jgi:uncharacterized NAD(P)/FAD-binding protein YdhS
LAPDDELVDVAIVGGGFSGVTLAAQLARVAPDLRVAWYERRERVGPGVAYSTPHAAHLTNSRARAMSAFEDDAEHFVRWLDGRGGRDEFVPRRLYGEYLASIAASLARPELRSIRATVTAIEPGPDGAFRVASGVGAWRIARAVVIATGNLESETAGIPPALLAHPRFIADPYRASYGEMRGDVLVVGSGLSALDAVVALDAAGFEGVIHTLSRRGLFPLADADRPPYTAPIDLAAPRVALELVRACCRIVAEGERAGYDWRSMVEAIRAEIPRLWDALDTRERGRFVRHVQRFWSVHRHRSPERVDALRERLESSGRLRVHRGRIVGIDDAGGDIGVRMAGRDAPASITVAHAINAHGPTGDYTRCADPLIRGLVNQGLLVAAPLALGLIERQPGLFLVGPVERWSAYESTAVPELRRASERLAGRLLDYLSS